MQSVSSILAAAGCGLSLAACGAPPQDVALADLLVPHDSPVHRSAHDDPWEDLRPYLQRRIRVEAWLDGSEHGLHLYEAPRHDPRDEHLTLLPQDGPMTRLAVAFEDSPCLGERVAVVGRLVPDGVEFVRLGRIERVTRLTDGSRCY